MDKTIETVAAELMTLSPGETRNVAGVLVTALVDGAFQMGHFTKYSYQIAAAHILTITGVIGEEI